MLERHMLICYGAAVAAGGTLGGSAVGTGAALGGSALGTAGSAGAALGGSAIGTAAGSAGAAGVGSAAIGAGIGAASKVPQYGFQAASGLQPVAQNSMTTQDWINSTRNVLNGLHSNSDTHDEQLFYPGMQGNVMPTEHRGYTTTLGSSLNTIINGISPGLSNIMTLFKGSGSGNSSSFILLGQRSKLWELQRLAAARLQVILVL